MPSRSLSSSKWAFLALRSFSKSVKLAQMIDDPLEKDLLWGTKAISDEIAARDHRLLAPHQD
jgi:hypothetical protein